MSRRNDRGYSSDMDGGSRGGRGGSMRGRGGRGRGGPGRPNDSRYSAGSTTSDYVNSVDKHKTLGSVRGRGPTANGRPSRSSSRPNRGGRDVTGGGDK